MIPKNRPPVHPGEVLQLDFLDPLGMTQTLLAAKMKVPIQRINTLIAGKRNMSAETAVLLARVFAPSAEFWMNLQAAHDIWHAQRKVG
ncbi:MAG: plasmid maintenance system antidote protein, family [Myxococcaceae bacterium]|nr:plasmid maintenance system antidote protein, family [Myxococcaceae bacterium]